MPFLGVFLRDHQWSYDQIGLALAITGFSSLVMQIPAGIICDWVKDPRLLLSAMAIALGVTYTLIPPFANHFTPTIGLLLCAGAAGTFFAPLLGRLALGIAGREKLNVIVGQNRSWNHAGNMTSSFIALGVAHYFGLRPLFFLAAIVSIGAAICAGFVKGPEVKRTYRVKKRPKAPSQFISNLFTLIKHPTVRIWLFSTALFFIASGPLGAMVGLYIQHLGGSDSQVAMVSLVAEPVMIPFAWLAGKYSGVWGRKPVFAVAFLLLPLRIFLYTLTSSPITVLAITSIDGMISGIFGVMVVLISGDLTKGQSGLSSLIGLGSAMPALGAVLGSLLQGYLIERFSFGLTFSVFALIALIAAAVFLTWMPETKKGQDVSA